MSLTDFRSWPTLELALRPGVTVFLGRNGAGKTNLIEAIGYLAHLSSHRVATDQPLIRRGAERAHVAAAVVSDGRELTLEVEITAGKSNRARINKASPRPARTIAGIVRSVLFAPEDLALVKGDRADRRRFLDELATTRAPRIAGVRSDYDKIVRQRATLLKTAGSARRAGGSLATLDVWDEHLARTGAELMKARIDLVDQLRPYLMATYHDLAPDTEQIDITYQSAIVEEPGTAPGADQLSDLDTDTLAQLLLARLAEVRTQELDRGVCLAGPHRDDLAISLHGGPAKGFASHGESWSVALALRIASYRLLCSDSTEPILILDDVFAELDAQRRDLLADIASQAEQTLITAAAASDVPASLTGMTMTVTDPEFGTVSS